MILRRINNDGGFVGLIPELQIAIYVILFVIIIVFVIIPPNIKEYKRRKKEKEIIEKKKIAEKIENCNQAIHLNPNSADAYYKRGIVYDGLKKYDKAIEDYSKAINLNSKHAEAYIKRGYVYYDNNKSKACEDWKKACELGRCDNLKVA